MLFVWVLGDFRVAVAVWAVGLAVWTRCGLVVIVVVWWGLVCFNVSVGFLFGLGF